MPLFLYQIEPARAEMPTAPTAEEGARVGEHFAYLTAAWERGEALYVGRTETAPFLGVAVIEAASQEDAERFLRADPGIAAGVFRGRIQPFREIFPFRR